MAASTIKALSETVARNDISDLSKCVQDNLDAILNGRNFRIFQDVKKPGQPKKDPRPDLLPRDNLSLLHIAAYYNNFEIFLYLLDIGAAHGDALSLRTPSGASYFPFHYACYGSSIECASYILEQDPGLATLEHDCQWQPVLLATYANCPQILEMLIDHKVDLRSPKNLQNQPFHQALRSNAKECLDLLLRHSCKMDVDGYNQSPLMVAITRNVEGAVEWLLDLGYDPYFVSIRGETALSVACTQNDLATVKLLCEHMDYVEIPTSDERHSSIARWAVASGDLEILRTILKKGQIDVNRYDAVEEQPVDAIRGIAKITDELGLKILEMLIDAGYDIHSRSPRNRKSFLNRLVEFTVVKYPKIVDFLLANNVDPRTRFLTTAQNPVPQTTLGNVKAWKASRYARPIQKKYVEIFAKYFPEEFA
jgi:ankyrin repeat protein